MEYLFQWHTIHMNSLNGVIRENMYLRDMDKNF